MILFVVLLIIKMFSQELQTTQMAIKGIKGIKYSVLDERIHERYQTNFKDIDTWKNVSHLKSTHALHLYEENLFFAANNRIYDLDYRDIKNRHLDETYTIPNKYRILFLDMANGILYAMCPDEFTTHPAHPYPHFNSNGTKISFTNFNVRTGHIIEIWEILQKELRTKTSKITKA